MSVMSSIKVGFFVEAELARARTPCDRRSVYAQRGQRSPPLSRVCGSGCGVAAWRARTFAKTESEIIVSLSARACVYFVLYLTSALHAPRPHTPLRQDLGETVHKYVISRFSLTLKYMEHGHGQRHGHGTYVHVHVHVHVHMRAHSV